jgi:hypothetical protein
MQAFENHQLNIISKSIETMINKAYFTFCTRTGQRHLIDQACGCCEVAVDFGKSSMSNYAAKRKAKKLKAKEKKTEATK